MANSSKLTKLTGKASTDAERQQLAADLKAKKLTKVTGKATTDTERRNLRTKY
jgi:hypothetical protein